MKIVHTADWHLGHRLGSWERDNEHAAFLAWLLELLEDERADALFVCGDVFDRGNPSPEALSLFYAFIANVRSRLPRLQLVIIGGNHDSPARLDAPAPVLASLSVSVRGALPRTADGALDAASACVPLTGSGGDIEAVAVLLPFVRPVDTLGFSTAHDVCVRVIAHARAALPNGAALCALGHGEATGAAYSPDSERRVLGAELGAATFEGVSYAALGHLHLAQGVGDQPHIRYSGSPLPLSIAERDYRHAVTVVELAGATVSTIRQREVPRHVDMVRVGHDEAALSEVLDRLRALDLPEPTPERRPFLDVRVGVSGAAPDLRAQVERALEGQPVRLVRVVAARPAGDAAPPTGALIDAVPESLLEQMYRRRYGSEAELPAALRAAFRELQDEVVSADASASGTGEEAA